VTRAGLDAARALPLEVQRERAEHFAALHRSAPLVLPNAWDVASAAVIVQAGAAAVATTSGGQSWSLGVPDGRHLRREQVADLVRAVTAVVGVPVTADVEDGYGDAPDELAETVRAVLAAGAVGINVEDSGPTGLRSAQEQAARFRTVRAAADEVGVPLFVNARTDVFLLGPEPGATDSDLLEGVVSRAEAYAAAGADGLFVPGLLDLEALRELVLRVELPVGVMTGPGAPSVAALAAVGVRRVSAGTALAQSAYTHAQRAARELLTSGSCRTWEDALGYGDLNALLSRR
jgi:2-methylisocitrate lyase-like PEP mutase family enzyme